MELGAGAEARSILFLNNGDGTFETATLTVGQDNHQTKLGDIDGDGDLDIVSKPLRATGVVVHRRAGGGWLPDFIDTTVASGLQRDVFVRSGDIDGDGDPDLATSGRWFENPAIGGGGWTAHVIGGGFGNLGAIADVDRDGDLDLFGTAGVGADSNGALRWAENDGSGTFTVHTNLPTTGGDFLQGVEVLDVNGQVWVALSWHNGHGGTQYVSVPPGNARAAWTLGTLSTSGSAEDLDSGDIDGDGDVDVLSGGVWLRNDGGSFTAVNAYGLDGPASAAGTHLPDRNRLADLDSDGDLDIVVVYERWLGWTDSDRGWRVDWFENQGGGASFVQHTLGYMNGGHSLDVGDIDGNGHLDVVVGEHAMSNPADGRVFVFLNTGSPTGMWPQREIHVGMEHHDGTIVRDFDLDGALDVASIGWDDQRLMVFTNPLVSGPVTVHEDNLEITVTNANSTIVFERANGGISSMFDRTGADWVAWSPAAGGAGEFRGLPNAGFPGGNLHPGFLEGSTRLIGANPAAAILEYQSDDGQWRARWTVEPDKVTFEMLAAPQNFWVLYEGPPGGSIDAGDRIITSTGTTPLSSTDITTDVADDWIGVGDVNSGRTLLLFAQDNTAVDRVYQFENTMAVVGFGRGTELQRHLTAPFSMVFGFVDSLDAADLGAVAGGW